MSDRPDEVQKLFEQALQLPSSANLGPFLDEACGDDEALRSEVETLLRAHGDSGNFLGGVDKLTTAFRQGESCDRQIGPYKLLQQIGEGGFGVVFMAEQIRPVKRRVAIKIIKPGMATKDVVARFEAERQALALMDHINIAKVLDGGATDDGRPYFVMELVKGVALTEFCDKNRLSIAKRLRLFKRVCLAIQHAHQKGVIHRDIKPSNVMVTLHDGEPIPKVIDFGIAKAMSRELTEKTMFTAYGQVIGTPQYMSPEQAEMSGLDIDTRSDVYSLGVLLYELITGTTPLEKESLQRIAFDELCKQIREFEAISPSARISTLKEAQCTDIAAQRQLNPMGLRTLLRGDLDLVVLKALEKDRERRYGSPKEFAADVERFLSDQPVEAVPPSPFYLASKYVRRNRGTVLSAATILVMLIVTTAFSTWQAFRATEYGRQAGLAEQDALAAKAIAEDQKQLAFEQKRLAEEAERKKESQRRLAVAAEQQRRRELYVADMALAAQLMESQSGDAAKIEELLAAWIPTDYAPEDWRDFSWRYIWTQLHKNSEVTVFDTIGAAISQDGHLITATNEGLFKWNGAGNQSTLLLDYDTDSAVFSPLGDWVVLERDGQRQLVHLSARRRMLDIPEPFFSFSSDGRRLVTWDQGNELANVWRLPEEVESDSEGPVAEKPLNAADASWEDGQRMPDNSRRLQLSDDGLSFLLLGYPRSMVVSLYSSNQEPALMLHRRATESCTWSPDGLVIATGDQDGGLRLSLRSDPDRRVTVNTGGKQVRVLRFSEDGNRLAVGGSDGTFDLWDTSAIMEAAEGFATPKSSQQDAEGLKVSEELPDSLRPTLLHSTKAHLTGGIESLDFSADGSRIATFAGGVSKLWDLNRIIGKHDVREFGEDLAWFSGTYFNSHGALQTSIRQVDSNNIISGELRPGDKVLGLAEGADLFGLYSGPKNSMLKLTVEGEAGDRREVELVRRQELPTRPIRLCFSPAGETVAVSEMNGASTINLRTGESKRYPYHGSSVVISPDGQLLAMDCSTDVYVWNLRSNELQQRLDGRCTQNRPGWNSDHGGGSLAFSPDGKFLALGTGFPHNPMTHQSDLRVWRVSDWKEIGKPLFQHDRVLSDLTFTPDSKHLVATSHQGIVRVWDTATWDLQDRQFDVRGESECVAISLDGQTLATGSQNQIVFWDFASGEKRRVVSATRPARLAFAPDGKTLVSGHWNHDVVLWDVATGKPLRTFRDHSGAVLGVAFSADGNAMASVDLGGTLRLWQAAPFEEIDRYEPTLESLLKLGQRRIREECYAEAEAVLVRLLQLQRRQLPAGSNEIDRTKSEIAAALKGQDRLPQILEQPESVQANVGETIRLSAELNQGPWQLQWYRNNQPIEGETRAELSFELDDQRDYGVYHLQALPRGRNDVEPTRSEFAYIVEPSEKIQGACWKVFEDIKGLAVANLTEAGKYPDQPDAVSVVENLEIPHDAGDYYGGEMSGWLTPPVTGEYVFYVCSDDQGQFFLSNTDSRQTEELRVTNNLSGRRLWTEGARSDPIFLERGKRYWFRGLFKEGHVGDHFAVAWQPPGQRPPKDGARPIPGLFLSPAEE